jgi:hypothetical protein
VSTSVTYGNLEHHEDFLCNVCLVGKSLAKAYSLLIAFSAFSIFMFYGALWGFFSEGNGSLAVMLLGVALALAGGTIWVLKTIRKTKSIRDSNERYPNDTGWNLVLEQGGMIYRKIAHKAYPGKELLSMEQYKKLLAENAFKSTRNIM